jgi:hypothetical protein
MATTEVRRPAIRIEARELQTAAMDEEVFVRRFRDREGPYHLYDSRERPLIRSETGAHVFGTLLENRTRLVFLDDPGCPEVSAVRIMYPVGEWFPGPIEPKVCSCGEGWCQGRLVITLHEAHVGPDWMLTFRG